MRRSHIRAAGHTLRVVLFVILGYAAVRFFLGALTDRGWGPGTLFGLLLVAGAASLVWRSTIDLRKALRRVRA